MGSKTCWRRRCHHCRLLCGDAESLPWFIFCSQAQPWLRQIGHCTKCTTVQHGPQGPTSQHQSRPPNPPPGTAHRLAEVGSHDVSPPAAPTSSSANERPLGPHPTAGDGRRKAGRGRAEPAVGRCRTRSRGEEDDPPTFFLPSKETLGTRKRFVTLV